MAYRCKFPRLSVVLGCGCLFATAAAAAEPPAGFPYVAKGTISRSGVDQASDTLPGLVPASWVWCEDGFYVLLADVGYQARLGSRLSVADDATYRVGRADGSTVTAGVLYGGFACSPVVWQAGSVPGPPSAAYTFVAESVDGGELWRPAVVLRLAGEGFVAALVFDLTWSVIGHFMLVPFSRGLDHLGKM